MSGSFHDIFISYSSKDRAWVAQLAQALSDCGFSVWWDRELVVGDNFYREIQKALTQAYCVVTVWSEHSVESEWVLGETSQAAERGVLVPVMYRESVISPAFHTRHNANLRGWRGDVNEAGFQELLRGVERVLQRPATNMRRTSAKDTIQDFKNSFLGDEEYMKYWITAGILLLLLVLTIIGVISLRPEPSSSRGDCSGDVNGDITGSTFSINCSKGN